ncbi:MAG: NAD-dependent epimerase/dehydratase family protein [Bacteroides sp.]
MLKIGITGQAGFVGTHLFNTLGLLPDKYTRIPFEDVFFSDDSRLRAFIRQCDVIVHLAAMNRNPDPQVIYTTNIELVNKLISALEAEKVAPHLIFSSSTQEERDNEYGRSKRDGRELLEQWAARCGASFTGMVVPNVYGPFGCPNYNSFIATFCYKLTHGEQPTILQDSLVNLIYVGSLVQHVVAKIDEVSALGTPRIERDAVPYDFEKSVSEILTLLQKFKTQYFDQGFIPALKDTNEVNLFNTFRCYIDHSTHFPVKLVQHADARGVFVETIKLGVGGQVSFSTTVSGITRGNHYHSRKIERFTVISGKARIQLRKIGTDEVLNFFLDGDVPSYVDMPIWYTHDITNIGKEELYTQFWINEWYDSQDGDTFFETV